MGTRKRLVSMKMEKLWHFPLFYLVLTRPLNVNKNGMTFWLIFQKSPVKAYCTCTWRFNTVELLDLTCSYFILRRSFTQNCYSPKLLNILLCFCLLSYVLCVYICVGEVLEGITLISLVVGVCLPWHPFPLDLHQPDNLFRLSNICGSRYLLVQVFRNA